MSQQVAPTGMVSPVGEFPRDRPGANGDPPARAGPAHSWKRSDWQMAAMTLPAALVIAMFFIGPAIWAIYASLTDRSVGPTSNVIWLDNYRFIWNNPDFLKFVRNTVFFVLGSAIVGQTCLGMGLALLIDYAPKRRFLLSTVAYAAVLVAWISPPTFAGNVWGDVFNVRHGLLNSVLGQFGIGRIDMLGRHAMLAVIIADAWRGTAFAMVIFLGALRAIPGSIYEAARVDGANAWRLFVDQTLGFLRPTIAIVMVMTTLVTSGSFLLILILTNGDPGYQTETIALFAYHRAFGQFQIGYGAAVSVILLLLNLMFAVVYLRLARVE